MTDIERATFELEDVLIKLSDLGLQKGEILALVNNYIDVHLPGCIEEYEDGTSPIYFYGAPERIKLDEWLDWTLKFRTITKELTCFSGFDSMPDLVKKDALKLLEDFENWNNR